MLKLLFVWLVHLVLECQGGRGWQSWRADVCPLVVEGHWPSYFTLRWLPGTFSVLGTWRCSENVVQQWVNLPRLKFVSSVEQSIQCSNLFSHWEWSYRPFFFFFLSVANRMILNIPASYRENFKQTGSWVQTFHMLIFLRDSGKLWRRSPFIAEKQKQIIHLKFNLC